MTNDPLSVQLYPVRIHRLPVSEARGLPDGLTDPFVFRIEASNNGLDYYFTHMSAATLANFAQDAANRVQFLDSHNSRNLGYGRTFAGLVEEDAGRAPQFVPMRGAGIGEGVGFAIEPPSTYMRALLDVYTVPGIRFGGQLTYASTDDFITAVNAGLAEDVSVGFYGGGYTCDICGGDYTDYRACEHLAGRVYGIGEQGERKAIATVTIDGAHLAEVSAVYDGATPNATILKAQEAARVGLLDSADKRFMEVRYKVTFPGRSQWAGVDLSERQARSPANPTEEQTMDYEKIVNEVRAALAETNAPEGEVLEQVRWLADENGRLRPLADAGRQYRADLVDGALAEGVRAFGQEFNQEQYRAVLDNSGIDVIKLMAADWRRIGDGRFPNGRQTQDAAQRPETEQPEQARKLVPDEAYS